MSKPNLAGSLGWNMALNRGILCLWLLLFTLPLLQTALLVATLTATHFLNGGWWQQVTPPPPPHAPFSSFLGDAPPYSPSQTQQLKGSPLLIVTHEGSSLSSGGTPTPYHPSSPVAAA